MKLRDELINRIIRYPGAVAMRLRIVGLRLLGAHIGRNCWIRRIEVARNPWDVVIGNGVALDDHLVLLTRRFKYLAALPFLAAMTKACTPKRSKAAAFDQ
jgi:hypothetical protein